MRLMRHKARTSSWMKIGAAGAGVAAIAGTVVAARFGRGVATLATGMWDRMRGRRVEEGAPEGQLLMSNRPAPARDAADPLRQGEPLTATLRPQDAIGWASEPEPALGY
jgi:hypothetical protein